MKVFLKLLLLVVVAAYLVFAFVRLTGGEDTSRCRSVHIVITDSMHAGFITKADVERLLKSKRLYPIGEKMDKIDGLAIEKSLKKHSFVKNAVCFKGPDGRVSVLISQRLPVMRVMGTGGNYYVDEKGNPMKTEGQTADLIVATGLTDRQFVKKYLIPLVRTLNNDPFWSDQIEQINVEPDRRLTLVPRVGAQIIRFGQPDTTETRQKLRNLRTFYNKVMPTVGWNTYKEINLEYTNQVICKKG